MTRTMTRNEVSHENSPVPLLSIHDLAVSFETKAGIVRAVSGVDLTIYPKQTLAVVGESGCGKTVTALSILNLLPVATAFYERGSIIFEGDDLLRYTEREMRSIRGGQIAMIFQEPMASLNPVFSIGDQIIEAVMLHQQVGRKQARDIAVSALNDVGMTDAAPRLHAYPHEFSGGMRQRVMIAMALACRPKLLIADEPTTALDVTIQAQTLKLINGLKHDRDLAVLFITHDLGVVAQIADVVCVMYAGRVVEYADVFELFRNPLHPYTRGLLDSIPRIGRRQSRLKTIDDVRQEEEVYFILPGARQKSVAWWPQGMRNRQEPACLQEIVPGHWVACTSEPEEGLQVSQAPDLSFVRDGDREPC